MASPADASTVYSACLAAGSTRSSAEVSLPEGCQVIWQCDYERNGQSYWWDLPADVSAALERVYAVPVEGLSWVWCWNPTDAPEDRVLSRYVLNPHTCTQRNLDTDVRRPLRRVFKLRAGPPDAETPQSDTRMAEPVPPAESDTDMAPTTAPDTRPECRQQY